MSDLVRRTALVTGATGATRGIGRGVAELIDKISADGGIARFVAAGLGDSQEGERLARETGGVDILVNNAGIYELTPELMLVATGDAWPTRARGRIGDPTEIAQVVLFLVQSGSSFVNGTIVGAHGGERSLLPS